MREEDRQSATAHWLPFVQAFVRAYELGAGLSGTPLGAVDGLSSTATPVAADGQQGPVVLLCSPHPDDETLTGALPLRLLREQGATVINLAVTLGSNPTRQAERWAELQEACALLGFDCQRLFTGPGFDLKAGATAQGWPAAVQALIDCLDLLRPDFVVYPHALDRHPAHVATNSLVAAALARWTAAGKMAALAVETEYWQPMPSPNLLLGIDSEDEARLLAALACHRGEIARNPYHLTHPARLLDNVRRGAELVRAPLTTRPDFLLGELYRLSLWRQGGNQALDLTDGWLGPEQDLVGLFESK